MRTTFGLCFLALALTATTAHAQGVFLEKGQPGVGVALGGGVIGNGWNASLVPSLTYRGVFDVGLEMTGFGFTSGDTNHLGAIGLMPFTNVYFTRSEDGPLPISISGTLGVQKRFFLGNGNAPNPDGWGLLAGGSAFRRIAFSDTFAGIPELFVAYDLQVVTWHSGVIDSKAGASPGQKTDPQHKARVLIRANMSFRGEKTLFTLTPYLGYQAGLAVGINVGAIF
jgi:hypothetical protein